MENKDVIIGAFVKYVSQEQQRCETGKKYPDNLLFNVNGEELKVAVWTPMECALEYMKLYEVPVKWKQSGKYNNASLDTDRNIVAVKDGRNLGIPEGMPKGVGLPSGAGAPKGTFSDNPKPQSNGMSYEEKKHKEIRREACLNTAVETLKIAASTGAGEPMPAEAIADGVIRIAREKYEKFVTEQ